MRWTKTLSKRKRNKLAKEVREHREKQLLRHRLGYSAARTLGVVSREERLEGLLRERMARLKRPLRFLDSGAGHAGVSADLKRVFGEQIEVTALTLRHPNVSKKSERRAVRDVRENPRDYYPFPSDGKVAETGRNLAKEHAQILKRAREDVKVVDHPKVGLIENLQIKRKYDVVFDYCGPIQYSMFMRRVAEQYSKMLPKGGLLVTNKEYVIVAVKFLRGKFKLLEINKDFAVLERV